MEKKQISEKLKNMLINSVTSFHNFETENNSTSQNLDELTTDELKNKIKALESKNKQIDEELFSIKNKYYVQAKILNDKNAELSKEVSERQRIKVEMEKINNASKELQQKINTQKKTNEEISQENNNLKKQLLSISKKYNDTKLKSSSLVSKLKEEKKKIETENNSMKEENDKLQKKISAENDTYNNELVILQKENENLKKEIKANTEQNEAKVKELQQESIKYVSANAQRRIVEKLIDLNILTEEELDVFNRGRNASSHRSKSTDIITYKKATGFECVIGYLYNNDRERCNYILDYIVGNNL